MSKVHETPGLERDITHAIERWTIDAQLRMPASVLATFVLASLTALETANRRSAEIVAGMVAGPSDST